MPHSAWLSSVYLKHRRELLRTAWAVLRRADAAEDAVHGAFLKLAKLRAPPDDPKLFVFRSVRNAAIDLAKARARRREEPIPADWGDRESAPSQGDDDVSSLLEDLLIGLDAPSREVIELHVHAALTFQEISQLLDEPLPTVASRYRRALQKLEKELRVKNA